MSEEGALEERMVTEGEGRVGGADKRPMAWIPRRRWDKRPGGNRWCWGTVARARRPVAREVGEDKVAARRV